MQIYIDTADIDEIRHAISLGIVDGVTTNPSLIKKAMDKHKITDMHQYIEKIFETVGEERPVSLEVIGQTADEMSKEGYELYTMFRLRQAKYNVVIKIPVNPAISQEDKTYFDGLEAIARLSHNDYKTPVNATLIMTPEQAWLAAKAGASYRELRNLCPTYFAVLYLYNCDKISYNQRSYPYVSPFVGRIDDYLRKRLGINFSKEDYFPAHDILSFPLIHADIHDVTLLDDNGITSGVDLVDKIVKIFRAENIHANIIAASVRNARQARELIETGVDIATIPFNVLREMASHQKTYEGVESFTKDIVPEYRSLFNENSAEHKEKPIA